MKKPEPFKFIFNPNLIYIDIEIISEAIITKEFIDKKYLKPINEKYISTITF